MKLYYYRHEGILNFGDDLNPFLWEQLLPGRFDEDESTTLVGFGTLLNDQLPVFTPKAKHRLIFSTGVGYFAGTPAIDDTYRFYCVRGPLSAQALSLPEDRAVADGAILIRRFYRPTTDKTHRFAFMPHLDEIQEEGWKLACSELGIAYIDPRWSTQRVLSSLCSTEILLAEAMHGAIVADALRIPWVPIVTSKRILAFKWEDWCKSVELEYSPMYLTPQFDPRKKRDILTPVRQTRYWLLRKMVIAQLRSLMQNIRPCLSKDNILESRTQQLEERLEELRRETQ